MVLSSGNTLGGSGSGLLPQLEGRSQGLMLQHFVWILTQTLIITRAYSSSGGSGALNSHFTS
jgi:hypothetical protein